MRYLAEAAVVRGLWSVAGVLPRAIVPPLGVALGEALWRVDPKRRRRSLRNLERVFGDSMTGAERVRLGRAYHHVMAQIALETVFIARRTPEVPVSHWFDFENLEQGRKVVGQHGAVILVSCHAGPWELLGGLVNDRVTPLHSVYRPLRNPYLNGWLAGLRKRMGMELIEDRPNAVVSIVRVLRSGGSVGLICDLSQKSNSLVVDFLGHPAATVAAPGVLATRLRLPVLPIYAYRVGPYRYRARFDDAILPRDDLGREENIRFVVEEMNRSMGRFIRAHPEQWHWNYRRWAHGQRPVERSSEAPS